MILLALENPPRPLNNLPLPALRVFPMKLPDLIHKTCLVGLSYFDLQGQLLKQTQLAGKVTDVDEEKGISILLLMPTPSKPNEDSNPESTTFMVPADLSCWFVAPPGEYKDPQQQLLIENPDYFVTWDIHQTQNDKDDGQHQWWDWVPRTTPPTVG